MDKKTAREIVSGTIRMHPRGFGFVVPDTLSPYTQDIFIPRHLADNAVDGDRVEVLLLDPGTWEKGPEGKIIAILSRARKHIAGTVRSLTRHREAIAHAPILGTTKYLTVRIPNGMTVRVGDRIIAKVIEWGDEQNATTSELQHVIGNINDPSIDIDAAVEEFDLRSGFPNKALEEARAWEKKPGYKGGKEREDLMNLECVTIDPETARDFDDALSISKDKNGHYHLGVHIADVAAYVKNGSALDIEAKARGNSTYFPGKCIPMLPEELSNNLCSLIPDVPRLTCSALMTFNAKGDVINSRITRSRICSRKRFTYEEAKAVLDKKLKSPHEARLRLMVELCTLLKKKREERGSFDFTLPEIVILQDERGQPYGVKQIEYDITHQLVEEFMLKANEVVAIELANRGKPVLYRVHEEPMEDNMIEFANYARSLGFKLSKKPKPHELKRIFEEAKKTSHSHQLSIAFIRSMKIAQYSPENAGHYGLALEYYCHFTSPIRRYSDLITERLLFDEEDPDLNPEALATHCSEQERISFRAETSVKTLKKLRLLKVFLDENPQRVYPAKIVRIKHFGIFFELVDLFIDGFLHISELENDYFLHNPQTQQLVGERTGMKYILGQTIHVRICSIDLIDQEARYMLISEQPRKSKKNAR